VDRTQPSQETHIDINRLVIELEQTLELVQGKWLRKWPQYAKLPDELLKVRHVALSGDGDLLSV